MKEILNKLEEIQADIYDLEINENDSLNKIHAQVSITNAIKTLKEIEVL